MKKVLIVNMFVGLAIVVLIGLNVYLQWHQSQDNKALQTEIASLNKQLSDLGDKSTDIQAQLDLLKEYVAPGGVHPLARK